MLPIWKDHIVTLGSAGPYRFRIFYEDGNAGEYVVYEGRAFARPGETAVKVRVNDVIADVLQRRIDIVKPIIDDDPMNLSMVLPIVFELDVWNADTSTWTQVDRDVWAPDWSYVSGINPGTDAPTAPITGRADKRQLFLFSPASGHSASVTRIKPNGTSSVQTKYIQDTYANAFELDVITNRAGTIILKASDYYPTYDRVRFGGETWTIGETCCRYVLYYLNAFGGWDSFLIEGLTDIADTQARTVHANEYDNADASAAGRRVSVNELTRGYTFRTGWLTDDESARMHHLLNSTDVYVHDLVDGTIVPVTLTGSETRYKTFRTNGRRFIDYTITAQLAQDRIRR